MNSLVGDVKFLSNLPYTIIFSLACLKKVLVSLSQSYSFIIRIAVVFIRLFLKNCIFKVNLIVLVTLFILDFD